MKKIVIVTGANRGLGKCLVDLLMKDEDLLVVSLSRSISLAHANCERIKFFKTDLSQKFSNDVTAYLKEVVKPNTVIYYFNNAATILPIKKIGNFNIEEIEMSIKVNLEYPLILVNQLLKFFTVNNIHLVNISSGAGVKPVAYWALYGASKAYMKMFFKVLEEEEKGEQRVTLYDIDPGVMDTGMQASIREIDSPRQTYFAELKKENKLISPEIAAAEILEKVNLLKS